MPALSSRLRSPCLLAALLLGGACATPGGPAAREGPLAGLRLPLLPGTGRALEVEGTVGGRPARVVLEVASPLTVVAAGCLEGLTVRRTGASVRVPQPQGGTASLAEVQLSGIRVGGRPLGPRVVGVRRGEARCRVWLGSDVLLPYALEYTPERREVALVPSRPAQAYAQPQGTPQEEVQRLELTREPRTDWPLVAARVVVGEAQAMGPFLLTTGEEASVVAASFARGAELAPGEARGLVPDALQLSPSLALTHVALGVEAWETPGLAGALGMDVWGRLRTTVDVRAGVVVVRRPRACAAGEGEEGCVALHVRAHPEGRREVVATAWRPLPEGARVQVVLRDAAGVALPEGCALDFLFTPAGAGEGLSVLLPASGACPWERTTSATLAGVGPREAAAPGCEGTCARVTTPAGQECECRAPPPWQAAPQAPEAPAEQEPEEREPEDPHTRSYESAASARR